jgi:threonine synthase
VDVYGGRMDETGELREPCDMDRLRSDIYSVSINDEQTRATIKDAYDRHSVILEPHGAVGWAGLQRYVSDIPPAANLLAVSVETAHPAKFPEEIQALLGLDPELPPSLVGLEDRPEHYERMSGEYEPFRDWLLGRFGKR